MNYVLDMSIGIPSYTGKHENTKIITGCEIKKIMLQEIIPTK